MAMYLSLFLRKYVAKELPVYTAMYLFLFLKKIKKWKKNKTMNFEGLRTEPFILK